MGGIGIMVGYAKNLSIDHNEITDGRYTGISVGWGWGAESEMCNYKIRNNKVTGSSSSASNSTPFLMTIAASPGFLTASHLP